MLTSNTSFTDEFWSEYRTIIHRFTLNRVSDPDFAEDIVQDVLLKAYRRLDTLKDSEKVLPWLFQITRNTITDHYRRGKPLVELDENFPAAEIEFDFDSDILKEISGCVRSLVDELPDKYRSAIQMSEIDGVPQTQVAEKLGVSYSGAKSRVQRGRQMLKESLLCCCQVELDRLNGIIDVKPKNKCDTC
jgi:RNA polymerase sigma-70 factor (ECF subfamily)